MDSNSKIYKKVVTEHYISNWGEDFQEKTWSKGPILKLVPDFTILEFRPTSDRKMWTYATNGMSSFESSSRIELHMFSSTQDENILELLSAICYYHRKDKALGLSHTVNFGRPWQDDSKASYGLISLPYLDGPSLEVLDLGGGKQVCFYWLIPITREEVNFKKSFGIDALEEKFDEHQFNYLAPHRQSVV